MMDGYWADMLERYAKLIREGKVNQLRFSCCPSDELMQSRLITIELEVPNEEAQVKVE